MSLIITAGYTWVDGEVVTAAKLNLAAVGTIQGDQSYTFANGSATAASINFTGSSTDGLYRTGSGIGIAIAGSSVALFTPTNGIQLKGTTTADSAATGYIGEYLESTAATSSVSLTSGNDSNITSLVNLPAGDWDISGGVRFTPAASTVPVFILSSTGIVSGTNSGNIDSMSLLQATFVTGAELFLSTPTKRYSIAAPTTVYLVGHCNFSVSTCTAGGIIRARRIR